LYAAAISAAVTVTSAVAGPLAVAITMTAGDPDPDTIATADASEAAAKTAAFVALTPPLYAVAVLMLRSARGFKPTPLYIAL